MVHMDLPLYNRCVSALYDTVLDAERWPAAIGDLAGLFQASTVAMFRYDYLARAPSDFRIFGHDAEVERRYASYYHRIDPAASLALFADVGQWLADERMLDLKDRQHQEYVQDFALRSNIGRVGGVKTHGDAGGCTFLSLQRPPGAERFGEEGLDLYRALQPHLLRVAQLQSRLERLTAGERIARAVLDRLQCGVLVCNAAGRLLLVNAGAEGLLGQHAQHLRAMHGHLSCALPADHERLVRALAVATAPQGAQGTGLRLRAGHGVLTVLVLPMPHDHDLAGIRPEPLALLAMGMPPRSDAQAQILGTIYGFSAAETALLEALLCGRSPAEHAADRGVRLSTVRTQMHMLLGKAGVSTQMALINLARGLPPLG